MGRTVSLPESLRITMGIFVTGSIISPRIFISTSIVISSRSNSLYHHFAGEAVGKSGGRNYLDTAADSREGGVGGFENIDFFLSNAVASIGRTVEHTAAHQAQLKHRIRLLLYE